MAALAAAEPIEPAAEPAGVYIVADDREDKVVPFLVTACEANNLPPPVVRRIHTGDFGICAGGRLLMIVERKTLKDLASSIASGRLEGQVDNMLEARQNQNPPPALRIYVEDRRAFPAGKTKFSRVPYAVMERKLLEIELRGIVAQRTKSCEDTANRLAKIAAMYRDSMPPVVEAEGVEGGGENLLQNTAPPDPKSIEAGVWKAAISGVGWRAAKKLAEDPGHTLAKPGLMTLAVGKRFGIRRSGQRAFNTLKHGSKSPTLFIKWLKALPGIGPRAATAIELETRSKQARNYNTLVKLGVKGLAAIPVGGKSFGEAKAKKILAILSPE